MTKNVKLLSLIGIAAALAGGSVAISNNNNSTVQAASITLPAGYTKSAIIKWNQTGKASKALIDASKKGMKENTNSDAGSDNSFNKFKNICVIVFLKCYKVCYNLATRW